MQSEKNILIEGKTVENIFALITDENRESEMNFFSRRIYQFNGIVRTLPPSPSAFYTEKHANAVHFCFRIIVGNGSMVIMLILKHLLCQKHR